jgi:hypothetical protein
MATVSPDQPAQTHSDLPPSGTVPIFIGCRLEELVELELDGLEQGRERARADGVRALRDMQAISRAAATACDRALAGRYVPLDEAKFCEVFTLAWCAGYHAEVEESPRRRRWRSQH